MINIEFSNLSVIELAQIISEEEFDFYVRIVLSIARSEFALQRLRNSNEQPPNNSTVTVKLFNKGYQCGCSSDLSIFRSQAFRLLCRFESFYYVTQ